VKFFDVFMARNFRPVPFQDAAAKFVYFTLKGDVESGSFKADVESANPAEQGGGSKARGAVDALPKAALRLAGSLLSIY
jgi:hypothetical protein